MRGTEAKELENQVAFIKEVAYDFSTFGHIVLTVNGKDHHIDVRWDDPEED